MPTAVAVGLEGLGLGGWGRGGDGGPVQGGPERRATTTEKGPAGLQG